MFFNQYIWFSINLLVLFLAVFWNKDLLARFFCEDDLALMCQYALVSFAGTHLTNIKVRKIVIGRFSWNQILFLLSGLSLVVEILPSVWGIGILCIYVLYFLLCNQGKLFHFNSNFAKINLENFVMGFWIEYLWFLHWISQF